MEDLVFRRANRTFWIVFVCFFIISLVLGWMYFSNNGYFDPVYVSPFDGGGLKAIGVTVRTTGWLVIVCLLSSLYVSTGTFYLMTKHSVKSGKVAARRKSLLYILLASLPPFIILIFLASQGRIYG